MRSDPEGGNSLMHTVTNPKYKLYMEYDISELFNIIKKYCQQKIKNYHISGDEDIEYKNKEQQEIAEMTPVEIFKSGGIVKTILTQKIEI